MKHRNLFAALVVSVMLIGGGSACEPLRQAAIDTVAGDVEAPADEARRTIAGGYEALASARDSIRVLYLAGAIDREQATKARDELRRVEDSLTDAEKLVDSGLVQQGLTLALVAKGAAEKVIEEVRK